MARPFGGPLLIRPETDVAAAILCSVSGADLNGRAMKLADLFAPSAKGNEEQHDPFCSASLVLLSEMHPGAKIVTLDVRDFGIYRRFRNEELPLICPR